MPDMHWNDKKLKLAALHQAARRGNLTKVEQLLKGKSKTQADEAGEFNDTPMMWAAYEGHPKVVNRLLAMGANVKAVDKLNLTPLHLAAANGHCEIITALLSKGANASVVDGEGATPLHWAVAGDYPDAIQVFTQNKVNADVQGVGGKTALHYAALCGHPASIRALIKGGANVNRADKYKSSPLHDASEKGHYIAVEALVNGGAKLNAKDKNGCTPLHVAAMYGHADIVEQLMDAGADAEKADNNGRTPLFYSQRGGHHDIAKMLIDSGQFTVAKSPKGGNVAEKIFRKVSFSIVYIEADTAQGTSQGSGVIVANNIVATNYHVVKGGVDKIRVHKVEKEKDRGIRIDESGRFREFPAKIWDADTDRDFCLLEVPDLNGESVDIRPYHDLRVGEDVYAIGNPLGETLTLSGGMISQKRNERGRRVIQTNAAISGGSSGGGLFDKEGNLIGITTESLIDGENLNYAIAADLLFGFVPGKR